jgi:hypothetical protein
MKTKHGAKSEFVRKFSPDMPAKQVAEAAQKAGLKLDEKYVYAIRAHDRKPAQEKLPRVVTAQNTVEDLLLAAASEIGISKAIGLLQEKQAILRATLS